MPTNGTRLQQSGYFGHQMTETEAGATAREWWEAACGLLPAVVLAAGCLTGAYWWMTNEVVHANAAEPARPLVQAFRPVSSTSVAAESKTGTGGLVRSAELHPLIASAQRGRRPALSATPRVAENPPSNPGAVAQRPNAIGSPAGSPVQLQSARVVALENSTEPSEEQPAPFVPADATPLPAIPVPTVLEEAPAAPFPCWQAGNHAGRRSWSCPVPGAAKQEPNPPAPLIRD